MGTRVILVSQFITRVVTVLGLTLLLPVAIWGEKSQQALGVVLADGTVYFALPPSLVTTTATFRSPNVPATYYFTLGLPENAGEPLQRVTFNQYKGKEDIKFDFEKHQCRSRKVLRF